MLRLFGLLVIVGILFGCGGGGAGGGGGPTGTLTVQVDWPARNTESVPSYANSIVAKVTVNSQTFTLTINRTGDTGYTGSGTFTQGIPIGTHKMTVTSYTATNGQGSAVATSSPSVTILEAQVTTENVSANLQSTVDHVEIDGPFTAIPGVPTQLTGHAENAAGQTLLLPGTALVWTLVSGPATLGTDGVLTGTAEGTALVHLREVESGEFVESNIALQTPVVTYTVGFSSDQDAPNKLDYFELYTVRTDGTGLTRVTNDLFNAHDPCFNSDGSRMVFTSNRDADFSNDFTEEIYWVNVSNGNIMRLTNNGFDDGYAAYSKDGTKIAFASMRDGNWEIYKMTSNGSSQTKLTTDDSEDVEPRWNNNATKIAFVSLRTGTKQIFTMNSDGTSPLNVSANSANDFSPSYSPDGSKIVFTSDRDGSEEIYIMNSNGSSQQKLTNNSSYDASPCFTQDGAKIIFVSSRDGNEELYMMNVDGSNVIRLTNNSRSDQRPTVRLN